MLSILWYSVCNFIAGFSPSFAFLFVVRAVLGIGMGAEWPAGATLAMESATTLTDALGAVPIVSSRSPSWLCGEALSHQLRSIGWTPAVAEGSPGRPAGWRGTHLVWV
jgi:MFS transporter, SHS family, lactate transporter